MALVFLAAIPVAPAVAASSTPWVETDFTRLRLVAATEAVGNGQRVTLGLHFTLNKNWKIYWRSAGDAGYPPQTDWSGSENLKSAEISWPAPERFSVLGFETLGYKDEVVLPIAAVLAQPGQGLKVRLNVNYLACAEICIPYEANLALDLPAGAAAPSPFVHVINRYSVRVPGDGTAHGLTIVRAESGDGGKTLRVIADSTMAFTDPDLYVEGQPELSFGKPTVSRRDGGRRVVMDLEVFGQDEADGGLIGEDLTLTLVDGARNAERTLRVVAVTSSLGSGEISLAVTLLLAVIGGLILNLMPCVLPVLSIKLLGAVSHGGGERRTVRLSFIASAAGILFAFLVLAAALVGLKASGMAVGWGIQFQQPWFLVAMTLVVTLFACNLWGFFEVQLPHGLADLGKHASHVHGLGGHFLSGAFATLLATPCSAPFLGTAIGFALARGPGEIVAVFTALGIGLALPYLVVAAWPGLATRLPRPGPWMIKLRRILGFALAVTAVWLLTVLRAQTGVPAALAVGALLVAAAAILFLARRKSVRGGGLSGRAGAVAAVAVVSFLAFLAPTVLYQAPADTPSSTADMKGLWRPFDEASIPRLVGEGKTVFVDVTADWCITCQVNKALVLYRGDVLLRLSGDGVVAMQADWTRPNEAISRYLAGFGRYGIPFNAVYGPAVPEGAPLPELLTRAAVLAALDRAAGGARVSSR